MVPTQTFIFHGIHGHESTTPMNLPGRIPTDRLVRPRH
ncbi:hypothetical protein BN2364_1653 [Alloalcanivorax xenomutans]|nr:hypothetical protein BN2364_1653 [Alloalcanivorax xenomutans]